jgi:hypothetical protein
MTPISKRVIALQQRGLATTPPAGTSMSWLHILETREVATWACDTTFDLILSVLNMFPKTIRGQMVAGSLIDHFQATKATLWNHDAGEQTP